MLESGQVWTLTFVPLFVIRCRIAISLFVLIKIVLFTELSAIIE